MTSLIVSSLLLSAAVFASSQSFAGTRMFRLTIGSFGIC